MVAKYLSCADTAKMVRQALKEAFPGVKFSVRSDTYSGGASINVRWIDGPNGAQVEAVAKTFQGAYFDGSQDYQGNTYAMLDGQVVNFGADFIFCNRDYSDAFVEAAIGAVFRRYAGNLKDVQRPTAEDWKAGRCCYVPVFGNYDLRDLIWQQLAKRSDRLKVEQSKTAGRVIYLGNDGYSDIGALNAEALA